MTIAAVWSPIPGIVSNSERRLSSLGFLPIGRERCPSHEGKSTYQPSGARIRFLTAMETDVTDAGVDTVQAFHDRLGEHCESPMTSQIIRTDDETAGLVEAVGDADLAIVGTVARSRLRTVLLPDRTTELLDELPCNVLLVRPQQPRQTAPTRRLVERYVF